MNISHIDRLKNMNPSVLFLLIAVLLGGFIRLYPVLTVEYPINDGGMFYTMTQEVIDHQFRLPNTTGYNGLNIPFAYPPFSFYMTGLIVKATSWDLMDIIRIIPAVFSTMAIIAFYLLVRDLVNDEFQIIIATLMFAFIPATFDWLIMGGGLTRSIAFFFSLLALKFIYRLYKENHKWDILWTVVFSSLTILSHPEAALHTAVSALVFFLIFGRNKVGLRRSLITAALIVACTAPWWVTVISRHDLSTFFSAGSTGFYNVLQVFRFLNFDVTHEYGLQTIGVLAIIGFFVYLSHKQNLFPFWLLLNYMAETRSAPLHVSPTIAILASYALMHIMRLINASVSRTMPEDQKLNPFFGKTAKGMFLLLFGQWVFSAGAIGFLLMSNVTLTASDMDAFHWVRENTLEESQFLVLTGNSPFSDPASEWFPSLTGRISVATVQGHEWNAYVKFEERFKEYEKIQKCINQDYACIDDWQYRNDASIDYIYIHNSLSKDNPALSTLQTNALGALLISNNEVDLVYQNSDIAIFSLK